MLILKHYQLVNKKEILQVFKGSILKPLIFAVIILMAYIGAYFVYLKHAPSFLKFEVINNLVGILLICDLFYMIFHVLKSIDGIVETEPDKANISLLLKLFLESAKLFLPALVIYLIFTYFFPISNVFSEIVSKAYHVGVIFIIMLFFLKLLNVTEALIKSKYSLKGFNNLKSRTIHTQIGIAKKLLNFFVILFSISSMFLVFDTFRFIGATIFTSAGIVTAIFVVAGQKSISSIIAGLQIAFLQPIRIGDIVALENESGRIEEITLTHVTLVLWDKRYFVVPILYFIEKPFQNLTKNAGETLGTVVLHVKYGFSFDALESYARSVCEKSELWDRGVFNLQVTDTTEDSVEVRVAVSAADPTKSWELRCFLRRKLVEYIQKHS